MASRRFHLALADDAPLMCDNWRAQHVVLKKRGRGARWARILRRRLRRVLGHGRCCLIGRPVTVMLTLRPVWRRAITERTRAQCAFSSCRMHLAELTRQPLTDAACALFYADSQGLTQKTIGKMLDVERAQVQQWESAALKRRSLVELADPYTEPTSSPKERVEAAVRRGEANAAEVAYICNMSSERARDYLKDLEKEGVLVSDPVDRNTARRWRVA
jgi:hypothetical protein